MFEFDCLTFEVYYKLAIALFFSPTISYRFDVSSTLFILCSLKIVYLIGYHFKNKIYVVDLMGRELISDS